MNKIFLKTITLSEGVNDIDIDLEQKKISALLKQDGYDFLGTPTAVFGSGTISIYVPFGKAGKLISVAAVEET